MDTASRKNARTSKNFLKAENIAEGKKKKKKEASHMSHKSHVGVLACVNACERDGGG